MITPKVAVVILNWNGKKYLERFLPSLSQTTYANMELVVGDNASTDDSIAFLRQSYPGLKILSNDKNLGFAGGYNQILARVEAEYYMLLNSDVEVTPGWMEPLVALMESDKSIGACQPKLLDYNHKDQFEYAGACGGWIDKFGYPFARGRVFEVCEKDNGQYETVVDCFWATGAALFIRAEVFHQLKGFDEYFFAHQEEIDLCWRMQTLGYRVCVQPASVVYHVGGGTLPRGNNMKVFLNFRNNLIMMSRNLPFVEAIWKIPSRMLLDGVAAYKGLFSGQPGYFWAIFKSHCHFYYWLFFIKNRMPVKRRPFSNLKGTYNGSIIWSHFVKKKKHFAEIVPSNF
jgi:GT2 family glycosyltransferase